MNDKKKEEVETPPDLVDEYLLHLPRSLNLEEKKYLLAVERGDLRNVKRILQVANKPSTRGTKIDVNCVDNLGRGAITLAIEAENLKMLELLVVMGVKTKDALLHAIDHEFVEAVELLLEHEELLTHNQLQKHDQQILYSWQKVDPVSARYSLDLTPIVLAAQRNNYEILKLLLDRGATLPMPHDVRCSCEDCIQASNEDPLKVSLTRISEYKALASPSLISLSSSDPLLTAFQLSWELKELAIAEPESKMEYWKLRRQVEKFAVDLLHQARSISELNTVLNYDPEEKGEVPKKKLAKLEQAIHYKQKRFVAHPHIQQLLAAIWYEGVPGFRRMSNFQQVWILVKTALLFPFYCLAYLIVPESKTGQLLQRPFMKFLVHASSYLFFLLILILVSQRAEVEIYKILGDEDTQRRLVEDIAKQRGNTLTPLEGVVIVYVIGFIWEETKEVFVEGLRGYLRDLWNFIDFTRNSLYVATALLRVAAYLQQRTEIEMDSSAATIPRERWGDYDPQLISEGLFAAANIFSALKLIHLFSINPHLGPLQISLGRMVIDIVKFFFIYTLVLFAFACGLNQLLWYFAELEKQKCYDRMEEPSWDSSSDACMRWRRFSSLFESCQSLFWASFGEIGLDTFELTGIKSYTRFWGLLMFGSYCVINVIVLLNLLIAMMSNSYAIIEEDADTEWKFARSKLWMSYFEEGWTLPPPFNILPPPKLFLRLCNLSEKKKSKTSSFRQRAREHKYDGVMRALIWRYVASSHSQREKEPASEDDIHELKSDMSSWRCELLNILNKNGMDTTGAVYKEKTGKLNVWERQLLQDFQVKPMKLVNEVSEEELALRQPPDGEDNISRWRRVAKLAVLKSANRRWDNVISGAVKNSQIGKSNSKSAMRRQKSLQIVIEEARRLVSTSPLPPVTPIKLPKSPSAMILKVLKDEQTDCFSRPDTPNTAYGSEFELDTQKLSPAAVHYEDEKYRKSSQLVLSVPKLSHHVFKQLAPNHGSPTNYSSTMSTLPVNHRSPKMFEHSAYEVSNHDNIIRPKPNHANSPLNIPDIEIIPVTPELKSKKDSQRLVKIAPKSPRISRSRSPRRGGWL